MDVPLQVFSCNSGDCISVSFEQIQHLSEISEPDLRRGVSRGFCRRRVELNTTVRRMEASIPEIFIALENAVDHCINFTGVVEAKSLLRTLDHLSKLIVWNGSCSLA
uniref:Uncharacterized protein n=1 Tax=Physcomitrium patens TaxID=3218 RepID=A0A2K1JWG5_PHYPA|nr:hypothetical protein PHYPA_015637 [Physcomitrium patens]